MSEPQLPSGCVGALIIALLAMGAYFMLAELARAWVWIKWAFQ